MTRPSPRFKIHDSTRVFAVEYDPHLGLAWRASGIARTTGRSVFLPNHHGQFLLDRIDLERKGEYRFVDDEGGGS